MIAEMREVCNRMCDAHRQGSSLVLLFDYDGTLTPIVEQPSLAVLDRKTRRLLADLVSRPRVYVGVLSGRTLDELKSLVRVPNVYLAGTGGMELDLRGLRIIHPHADRIANTMSRLASCLEAPIADYQGAWLEKKSLGLTVHYRHLPGRLLGPLLGAITDTTREFASEVRIVRGPKAMEITPANGWNKGMATRLILADLGVASDILFYAGDGENDSEAIEEVVAMGGITVGIGPDAPVAAACRLPNQVALLSFLGNLNSSLETRKHHFKRSSKDYLRLFGFRKSTLPTNHM
jgi:trehalose 6-phosphate phosphatase